MPRILITGASGLIGRRLVASFVTESVQIVRLVRRAPNSNQEVRWDPMSPVPPAIVSGFDAVIHLAGESVVGRWTPAKKQAIRDTRLIGTRNLALALTQASERPRVFVCASAIGYYGDRGDEVLTENSGPGSGFLADLASEWESASRIAADARVRAISLRIGLVLSPSGGALEKMLFPFRLGLGGRLGSGMQWWSWIHIDDIVGAIHHVLHHETVSGPVNLTAPQPVRNLEFTRTLASVLHRPALFPAPAFAMRLALGEMAHQLMLSSQRVQPLKLLNNGYTFRFPELRPALQNLLLSSSQIG